MRQRPLLLLTTAVLAAHVALLAWPDMDNVWQTARITGAAPKDLHFETRQIAPEPATPPAPEALRSQPTPTPPKAAAPKPPPPKAKPVQAPPEQSRESLASVGPTTPKAPAAPPLAAPSALDTLLTDDSSAPADTDSSTADSAPAPTPQATTQGTQALEGPDDAPPAPAAQVVSKDSASTEPPAPVGIGSAGYGAPLPPVRVPPSAVLQFEAKGSAKGFQYSAKAQLSFKTDGLTYQAKQEVSAFLIGSRVQTSTGRVTPHGLVPQRFGDKARSERAAHVDVDKGRITYSGNDAEQGASQGVQDRLSIFVQLGAMVAANPERYPPGTQIHINVTSARAADVWTFVVDGPETLELPGGSKQTIRLSRQPRKQYDQIAHLWLAPDLQYLPVRIRLTQANGDFADLQLQSADITSPPPN